MNCPECLKPMRNKGNESGIVYDALPPFWYVTYRCNECRIAKDVQVEQSKDTIQSNQIKKMTNDDYLYIKIPNLPFDQILVRHKETQILYNGQAISRQQVEAEARADERAKSN